MDQRGGRRGGRRLATAQPMPLVELVTSAGSRKDRAAYDKPLLAYK
jgi:hypothetical protein